MSEVKSDDIMSPSVSRTGRLPWAICLVAILLMTIGFGLLVFTRDTLVGARWGSRWIIAPLAVTFSFVGALIASRRPHNWVGWILLVVGLGSSLQFFLDQYAVYGLLTHPGSLPGAVWGAWAFNWIWAFFTAFALVFLPLLFPNGRIVSPRWKIVLWSGSIGFCLMSACYAFTPGPLQNFQLQRNPFGIEGTRDLFTALFAAGAVMVLVSSIAAASSLLVRWRHSNGPERQQLKWIAYAGAVMVVLVPFGFFPSLQLGSLLFVAGALGLPIAIGAAILKYRLYDIDLIIRRTVTYALVSAVLFLVFFCSIVVLQQLFASVTGTRQNELVTVLSTLVIAMLFVPLRNRIQNAIDRRFNRRKYDAQQVLLRFAETVRDETDLEMLSIDLINVVNETMRPRSVSLWLKKPFDHHATGEKHS